MKLQFEIQEIKTSLGKNRVGAQLTLADASRPQCLVPFSYYVTDINAFNEAKKCNLESMRFKTVEVAVTQMAGDAVRGEIKLSGELSLVSSK